MAMYMNAVIDFSTLHPAEGNEFLSYLENTIYNDRISSELPSNIVIAHKIGTETGAIHDIGIIYANKPFILAVMSKGVDENIAPEVIGHMVIGHIAKLIYDFEEN